MACLHGDLNQMYTQMEFLRQRGISVSAEGGIPKVKSENYEDSVKMIYDYEIIGWWNYKEDLIKFGVCTEEEFTDRLKWKVERRKREECFQ